MATLDQYKEMVMGIHHSTILSIQATQQELGNSELPGVFPIYTAIGTNGDVAVIGCHFFALPSEDHQGILNDCKAQILERGFPFGGWITQNCVAAIPSDGSRDPSSYSSSEIEVANKQLVTQFCGVDGQSLVFVSNFDNTEYGWATENETIQASEPAHIIWASATGISITFADLQQAEQA